MNILFLTKYFYPHIGGVETHVLELSQELSKNHSVVVLTQNYGKLPAYEEYKEIEIHRFKYPQIKFLGLFSIWSHLYKNKKLIEEAEIIHCHDVFIWYLPFKFLFPFKKVYMTFHGWEGVWPIPYKNIVLKKVSAYLSKGKISVGKYIEKYYGIKSDFVIYGGAGAKIKKPKKVKDSVVFLGRLDKDTGILQFLEYLKNHKFKKVLFVGDGEYKNECAKYGKVTGFTNPNAYLEDSEFAAVGGYLGYISAQTYGCKILTFADNPLKRDYWNEIKKQEKFPSWKDVSKVYKNLWGLV